MKNASKIKEKPDFRCNLVYFAWLKQFTGMASETREIPGDITTVGGLVSHLRKVSDGHAKALANMQVVRVAVNREYGGLDSAIGANDEIAFFPPVTGG